MSSTDDRWMYHGEYKPNQAEIQAVGSLGILLFSIIVVYASWGCWQSYRMHHRIHITFYVAILFLAGCDLPRYFIIAICINFSSRVGYAMHILSGIFYFICLALVGYTFANMLELGAYASLLYSKRGIVAAICIHAIVDLAGFGLCMNTPKLADFFTSQYYAFFIIWDIAQNLLYSSILLYFGLRLIGRFGHLEKSTSDDIQRLAFHTVVKKITLTLALISIFAVLRLILLAVKSMSLTNAASDKTFTSNVFPLYGVLWFALSDFLPRGGSSAAMLYLMRSERSESDIASNGAGRVSGNSDVDSLKSDGPRLLAHTHATSLRLVDDKKMTMWSRIHSIRELFVLGPRDGVARGGSRNGVMGDAFDDCFDISLDINKQSEHRTSHNIDGATSVGSSARPTPLPRSQSQSRIHSESRGYEDDDDGMRGGEDDDDDDDESDVGAPRPSRSPFHAPRSFR